MTNTNARTVKIPVEYSIYTVKHIYSLGLYFCLNSRERRDTKIKSSPIISNVRIIEDYMTNCKNTVS